MSGSVGAPTLGAGIPPLEEETIVEATTRMSAEDVERARGIDTDDPVYVALRDALGATDDVTMVAIANPAMFLALMRRRLGDLDQQIAIKANELENNTRRAEDLSRKLEALSKVQQVANARRDDGVYLDGHGDYIDVDGDQVPVRDFLEQNGIEVPPSRDYSGRPGISGETLQAKIDEIKQELQRVNSGNEMLMINMQSLMQQRQQIISLGSNVLNIYHESSKGVIGNIRP